MHTYICTFGCRGCILQRSWDLFTLFSEICSQNFFGLVNEVLLSERPYLSKKHRICFLLRLLFRKKYLLLKQKKSYLQQQQQPSTKNPATAVLKTFSFGSEAVSDLVQTCNCLYPRYENFLWFWSYTPLPHPTGSNLDCHPRAPNLQLGRRILNTRLNHAATSLSGLLFS